MNNDLNKVFSLLLEDIKNLAIAMQDGEYDDALLHFAKVTATHGAIGAALAERVEEITAPAPAAEEL